MCMLLMYLPGSLCARVPLMRAMRCTGNRHTCGGGAKFLGGNMKLAKINLLIYHTEEEEVGNLM